MTNKELQKLGRRELLQLLLEQAKEAERLGKMLKENDQQLKQLEESYERLRDRLDKKDAQIHELKDALEAERGKREAELARQILAQTTTNGLRARRCGKYFLTPGAGRVQTQWGPVGVKLARGYGVTHAKPEFEDAAALARAHGLPYRTVFEEAMKNWEENK